MRVVEIAAAVIMAALLLTFCSDPHVGAVAQDAPPPPPWSRLEIIAGGKRVNQPSLWIVAYNGQCFFVADYSGTSVAGPFPCEPAP